MSGAAASLDAPLRIDVFADLTCPWCYIGKRRLEAALAASPGVTYAIDWRPFQRDPKFPEDGLSWSAYCARNFGTENTEAALTELGATGREVGLDFRFDRIAKVPNTLDAHRLVYWAFPAAIKARIVEALFQAHFTDGADISDRNVLIALAADCGMDGEAAFDLFARRDDIDVLRREIETSRALVKQVPFFVFADDIIVPDGRSEAALKSALAKAIAAHL